MKLDMPSPPGPVPSYGIIENTDEVTQIVLRAISGAPTPRLREVMTAFVSHLHAFAREVRLTQDEYDFAIDFLNRIGKATTDIHNEGILFADAVGFSTLVVLMNNGGKGPTETAAALLGPFWRDNSPETPNGGSIVRSPTTGPSYSLTSASQIPMVNRSRGQRSMSGRLRPPVFTRTRTLSKRT